MNTFLATGIRASTLISIRISDIGTHEDIIFLQKLKNRKQQTIPISKSLKTVSSNMGVMEITDGKLIARSMLRSTVPEWKQLLSEELMEVAHAYGAECITDSDYEGWEYNPDSELRRLYFDLIREVLGHEMQEGFDGGGLETGFFATIPGMDIIEMQCTMSGLHSPAEKMDIASFNRMYDILVTLIERLP